MKKVGLILAYGLNYGAVLQAYATQIVIKNIGCDVEIISHKPSKLFRHIRFNLGSFVFLAQKVLKKIYSDKKDNVFDNSHKEFLNSRRQKFQLFIYDNFANICKYNSYRDLRNGTHKYDAVLIGSDQQWLPDCMVDYFSSLYFVPKNVRKISYATSLGVSNFPWYARSAAGNAWRRMNFISVREEQGKKIIDNICKGTPQVKMVCDPTYLLSKQEWEALIPYEQLYPQGYVLAYFLGHNSKLFGIARQYANDKGLKLVSIPSSEYMVEGDTSFADDYFFDANPAEFVNLVRGAECILTDSFHGLAFSVINEKQFYIFYPKRDNIKQSRNSRIDNILNMWGIKERLHSDDVVNLSEFDEQPIDYAMVTSRVDIKREESLSYLQNALKFDD